MELGKKNPIQIKEQEQEQINGFLDSNDLNINNKKSDHYYNNDGVPGY